MHVLIKHTGCDVQLNVNIAYTTQIMNQEFASNDYTKG